ncbi:MAG: hypothetical protein GY938_27240 [Ketobacter sp.]|nr:hypothetical protein [Ketobacter sp.]
MDWSAERDELNELHRKLVGKPTASMHSYRRGVGSILNAYREGDIPFDTAKELLAIKSNPVELREKLAAQQHEIWAHWMKCLFSQCIDDTDYILIPIDKAIRWKRQMLTDYADLTEPERESDRDQADKIIAIL